MSMDTAKKNVITVATLATRSTFRSILAHNKKKRIMANKIPTIKEYAATVPRENRNVLIFRWVCNLLENQPSKTK